MPQEHAYMSRSGERIRNAREIKGFSRPQLAERIDGLEASALGNWELGIRYPNDMEWFVKLSKVLKCSASYLAAIDDDPRLVRILELWKTLDERGKESLYRLAEVQVGDT